MKKYLPVGTALMLLALAGCQTKASVVGKWRGKSITGLPESTAAEKETKKQTEAQISTFVMEFKPDGTATMGTGGMAAFGVDGSYTVAGDKVTFTMDLGKFGAGLTGASAPKPMMLTLSPDGKTMTMTGDTPGLLTFERVP